MKAGTTFSLKDQLFNAEKVEWLASRFVAVYPDFSKSKFCKAVVSEFPTLELKQRLAHITECLAVSFPDDFQEAVAIILKALPDSLDPKKRDDDFGDFIIAPLSHFVATRGCNAEQLEVSLAALYEITQRFSAEDSIRFFINAFPEPTMSFLAKCAGDENYHVRRLASEGTRPKLPWCQKIGIDYREPIKILDALFSDETRYVTRSVANHLNDISKLDPELVIATLARWKKSGAQDEKEMGFIIRHATRTLVKQGSNAALALMGFGETPQIRIREFSILTPEVKVGEALEFVLAIESQSNQNLLIDYRMQFAGGGKRGGQKVFKLKQIEDVKADAILKIPKRHPMKLMTTRTLYAGTHSITLQVNGQDFGTLSFELSA